MGHISRTIEVADKSLSADAPYVSLGPAFDADDAETLKSLQVAKTDTYNNFGALERLKNDLDRFFSEIGNSSEAVRKAAIAIERFVTDSLSGLSAETAWLTIRASNPTAEFDVPRWHFDGYYFPPYEGEPRKIVLTLKGPGTLFNLLPPAERGAFIELTHIPHDDPERSMVIANALGQKHTKQAALHEAYLYIAGADHAAIHSEPPLHEDRLFMSLVPGSSKQIADLRERWNAKPTNYVA